MQIRHSMIAVVLLSLVCGCSGSSGLNGGSSAHAKKVDDAAKPGPVAGQTVEKDSESTDDDLRVIPPEVVSGAYLTCVDQDTGTTPPAGKVHHACAATAADGKTRVDLKTFKQTWVIEDILTSEAVATTDVTPPSGSKFDRIFELEAAAVARGIKTQLKVDGAKSSSAVLKSRGKCIVNGKVVNCTGSED